MKPPKTNCEQCGAELEQRPVVRTLGGVILGMACAVAVGMLLLIGRGETGWGGGLAALAMVLLGVGTRLKSGLRRPCKACTQS